MIKKKKFIYIFLILILVFSFFLRFYNIKYNHPFWVDEYSSANQARLILKYGINLFQNSTIYFEKNNILTHTIIALFFDSFGQKEWIARLPFVLIGSIIPLFVFILAKRIYNVQTALLASLFTTFSYFEITWSRQARGYILLQLFVLITILFYFRLQKTIPQFKHFKFYHFMNLSIFMCAIFLGLITHALFIIFLGALVLDILMFNRDIIVGLSKKFYSYIFLILILFILIKSELFLAFFHSFTSYHRITNNFWYYHSFLWREYSLFIFLSLCGFLINLYTKEKKSSVLFLYIIFLLLFLSFFFSAYTSRYLLSIFPLIFIQTSFTITYITDTILKRQKINQNKYKLISNFVSILLTLFIILNGNKFVIKPKSFYSVNHDFREIALIDYHKVYNLIKTKGHLYEGKTAVIDTWHDRLFWYLGQEYQPAYILRWMNEQELINGLPKKTNFIYNNNGEKILPFHANLKFIGELPDLQKAMKKYPKGFIFIDDSSLPKDVIDYAEKHFKKELYLDHYPLDDNPYSIWPATLYSWGI